MQKYVNDFIWSIRRMSNSSNVTRQKDKNNVFYQVYKHNVMMAKDQRPLYSRAFIQISQLRIKFELISKICNSNELFL